MNVSDQLISVLNALCEKFGIVIDWSQKNILPYAQELAEKCIRFEIITSIATCVMLYIAVAISWMLAAHFHKIVKATNYGYDSDYFLPWMAVIFWILLAGFSIAAVIVTAFQTMDVITCFVLPEKQIVELVSSLTTT